MSLITETNLEGLDAYTGVSLLIGSTKSMRRYEARWGIGGWIEEDEEEEPEEAQWDVGIQIEEEEPEETHWDIVTQTEEEEPEETHWDKGTQTEEDVAD